MDNKFCVAIHFHGTMSADAQGAFALQGPAKLIHVSANAANASDATLDVGDAGDTDGIIDGGDFGDSHTPAEFDPADFNGTLCDQVAGFTFVGDDQIVRWSMDHDGDGGTAAQNATIVFTFLEGGPQS